MEALVDAPNMARYQGVSEDFVDTFWKALIAMRASTLETK
jgi:hypothetical protein